MLHKGYQTNPSHRLGKSVLLDGSGVVGRCSCLQRTRGIQFLMGGDKGNDPPFFFLQESHALGRFCIVDMIAVVIKVISSESDFLGCGCLGSGAVAGCRVTFAVWS